MEVKGVYYRDCLKAELDRRVQNNPRYSMRSFARALEMDVAALSRVLAYKQSVSPKTASRLAQKLNLNPSEKDFFLNSVLEDQKMRSLYKSPEKSGASSMPSALDHDIFRVLSELHHFSILMLSTTDDFQSDPRWIAKRIGISVIEVKMAIERLIKVGLMVEEDGQWKKSDGHLTTADKTVTTPALRKHQRDVLAQAMLSLENDPIEIRNMAGVTMAIDPEKIDLAKKMIQEFIHNLATFLEGGKKKEVYQLSISLFPLKFQG